MEKTNFVIAFLMTLAYVKGQHCQHSKDGFLDFCSSLGGVETRGRCVYLAKNASGFIKAGYMTGVYEACKQEGGLIAQIHDSIEMGAISKYLQEINIGSPWIGLVKSDPIVGTCWDVYPNQTNWFSSDANQLGVGINLERTWIRTRAEACRLGNEYLCYRLTFESNYTRVKDSACAGQLPVLCVLPNQFQRYNWVTGCMPSEAVMDKFSIQGVAECTEQCGEKIWCRGFNIRNITICELTSWAAIDRIGGLQNEANCTHYTNAP